MLYPATPLTRFIFYDWWIINNTEVNAAAFLPSPVDGKTSVIQIAGLTESQITAHGDRMGAARRRPVSLLGRADLIAETVYEQTLDIEVSRPPSLHANIYKWPPDEAARLSIALELAKGSTLRI